MGNYLYNGVELPELPELIYPHAIIQDLGFLYRLYLFELKPKPGGLVDAGSHFVNYVRTTDGWLENSSGTVGSFQPGLKYVIWTNTDLYNEDGSLFLAASDPVPVGGVPVRIHLKSWLTGYALGLAGQPLPLIGEKAPVSYLVYADGYILQDVNGLYLIPKEGK